jgi:hypothetical protein
MKLNVNEEIALALKHLGGGFESSARVAIADAMKLNAEGDTAAARKRALKSLAYSCTTRHPDYIRAE